MTMTLRNDTARIASRASIVVALALAAGAIACSSGSEPSPPPDASAFVGTWQYTSQTGQYDCTPGGGAGPIVMDNPPQVITITANGEAIELHNGNCTLLFTVTGTSATLEPGYMCPGDTSESESLSLVSNGQVLHASAQWTSADGSNECSDYTETQMAKLGSDTSSSSSSGGGSSGGASSSSSSSGGGSSGGALGGTCTRNEDCTSGCCAFENDANLDLVCTAARQCNGGIGDECTSNAQCQSGFCANGGSGTGWCTEACSTSNGTCYGSHVASAGTSTVTLNQFGELNWCVTNTAGVDSCFPGCNNDGECVAFPGTTCTLNATTVTGFPANGICAK
jgi:hypothetical protein